MSLDELRAPGEVFLVQITNLGRLVSLQRCVRRSVSTAGVFLRIPASVSRAGGGWTAPAVSTPPTQKLTTLETLGFSLKFTSILDVRIFRADLHLKCALLKNRNSEQVGVNSRATKEEMCLVFISASAETSKQNSALRK